MGARRDRRRRGWSAPIAALAALACGAALLPVAAQAAIAVEPGADKVTTSLLALDFGDSAGNIERVDSVQWRRDTGAVFGANLAANGGPGCLPGDPGNQWGAAGSTQGQPQPVGSGTTGSWTARGRRSVEIVSSRNPLCTGDAATPVRTRYTFFDTGGAASKLRVERTISFSSGTPNYASTTMRPYVIRLPSSYSQVVHPNDAGNALVTDAPANPPASQPNWNRTWLALNNPATNAGVVILRESTGSAGSAQIRLTLDDTTNANASSVDLFKPTGGWKAPVTETEWLCFYDSVTWPVAQRAPTNLPSQCSVVPVPINTAPPTISGEARVASTLTATGGSWDGTTGALAFQWVRCAGAACAPIPGATSTTYTAADADEGMQLRIDVTGTAPGGETDTASAITEGIKPGPPTSTGLPTVSGEARAQETLTGTTGNWSGTPTSFEYQWLRCSTAAGTGCADVAGATATTYKLTPGDVGSTMRLRVRATNAQGPSAPVESAPTGVVQREVIRAHLSLSPNLTCTGLKTSIDGSASTTPNGPITRYRFQYKELPLGVFFAVAFGFIEDFDSYLARVPTYTLADGKDASPTPSFTWNRQLLKKEYFKSDIGDYAADFLVITLTVTDLAGATATATDTLGFAQPYSSESRAKCPKPFRDRVAYTFGKLPRVSATAKAVRARLPCKSAIECAGSFQVVRATSRRQGAKPPTKPLVIAQTSVFNIPAGRTSNVKATPTKAGRKLLRSTAPIPATIKITTITPGGKRITKSFPTTLNPKK